MIKDNKSIALTTEEVQGAVQDASTQDKRFNDATREAFASHNISVPKHYPYRRLVAVAFDDALGVIYDTKCKRIVSLLNSDDIDVANAMPCYLNDEGSKVFRISVKDNSEDVISSLPLGVAIMCYHNSNPYLKRTHEVHHVNNACDNRFEFLELRVANSTHKPHIIDSAEHIKNVFFKLGYTMDDALSIVSQKIDELRKKNR